MPPILTSTANPKVKEVVRLRQRSHRDATDRMTIEGLRELQRAMEAGHRLCTLFYCPAFFRDAAEAVAVVDGCRTDGVELCECDPRVFERLSYRDGPDGLLAVAGQVHHPLADLTVPESALVVVAQGLEKPGNLGSILRSADGAGAHAVLVCDRCTDVNNPNVVRSSVGTLFTVPVVETATPEALDWLAARAFRIVAATPAADRLYTETDMTGATALVVGEEHAGLSAPWLERATERVRIPMLGRADSLNVAASATLLLYEAVRQRGPTRTATGRTPRASGS